MHLFNSFANSDFPTLLKMACQEIGHMYDAMTQDMGRKMSGYFLSLQTRYGDPRVYAQQREQMAADAAAVQHSRSRKTEQLLEDAYTRQTERNRNLHKKRINDRLDRKSSRHPQSKMDQPRTSPQGSVAVQPSREEPVSQRE